MTIQEVKKYVDEIKKIIKLDDSKTNISATSQVYDPYIPEQFILNTQIGDYHFSIKKLFKEGKKNEKI